MLVTLLWHGDAGTRGVYLLGSLSGEALMARLEGTDVWFRTYTVRKDARFNYRLAPFRGAVPKEPDEIRKTATLDPLSPRRHPPGQPIFSFAELPLRFYLDVGSLEARPAVTGLNLYDANHRLEDALRAKGYDLLFAEYIGGHSYINWQGTVSDGLMFLLKR